MGDKKLIFYKVMFLFTYLDLKLKIKTMLIKIFNPMKGFYLAFCIYVRLRGKKLSKDKKLQIIIRWANISRVRGIKESKEYLNAKIKEMSKKHGIPENILRELIKSQKRLVVKQKDFL